MASAKRKILASFGIPRPKIAKIPNTKAMSVAAGIGQPEMASVPQFM